VTNKAASLVRNVTFNVGGYLVSVIVTFLVAPITIHTLGDTRYGAWSLVGEIVGYYGLLDLGIRGAVTYYIARHSAHNAHQQISETIASAFWILSASGFVVFSGGAALALAFPHLFNTAGLDLTEVRGALLIMSTVIGASLPMSTFSAVLGGRQRFDQDTIAEVLTRILAGLGVYAVLKAGCGLVALALVQAVTRLMYWGMIVSFVRRILGGFFIRPALFSFERVKALAAYGSCNLVTQIAQLVIRRLDLLVVAMFVGVAHVTYYYIGSMLVNYATTLCATVVFAFTPRFTELYSKGAHVELERLYLSGVRVTGVLVTGLVASILVFGRPFIRLWIGSSYVTGPVTQRSDVIMTVLILAYLPRMLQHISWQLLLASARIRFLMWLNLLEAAANLCLSLILVRRYELVGVAMGTLIPMVVSNLVVMPAYISRQFRLPLSRFVKKGLSAPLLTGAAIALLALVLVQTKPPTSWRLFFLEAVCTAIGGGGLCWGLGFTSIERRDLLARVGVRAPSNVGQTASTGPR
jgi:O-antigen/teichoic acid export membrane protein